MNYLSFDIECSNCFGGKPKMCEFGCVLADEKLNIIVENDIPMSPGNKADRSNRFDKSIYKRDPKFSWSLNTDDYFNYDEFPSYYQNIKEFLEAPNTIILGFSLRNDISFLRSACSRYNLPPIHYSAYDVQKMLSLHDTERKNLYGLVSAFEKYCPIEESQQLRPHRPQDDATMTIRIFQQLAKKNSMTPDKLIASSYKACYNSMDFGRHKRKH